MDVQGQNGHWTRYLHLGDNRWQSEDERQWVMDEMTGAFIPVQQAGRPPPA